FGSNWQVHDAIADDILDDLLKREWEKHQRLKSTKKLRKTLPEDKCMHISASSTESSDSILKSIEDCKIPTAILGRRTFHKIYLNFEFLRSLLQVKRTASSSLSSQNMDFVSSPSSTNKVNIAYGVSTSKTQVSNFYYFTDLSGVVSTCHKKCYFVPRDCRGPKEPEARTRITTALEEHCEMWKKHLHKPWWLIDESWFLTWKLYWQWGQKSLQTMATMAFYRLSSKSVSEAIFNEDRESLDASLVEELVLDDTLEKKTVFSTVAKMEFVRPKQQEKPVRKLVKLCNYHQREMVVFGNNYTRVNYNYSTKKAHPSAHRNMVTRAVLMKTGLRLLNTATPVNTAHPKTIVYSVRPMSHFSKSAQSTVKMPYQIRTSLTNKIFSQKVNAAKGKFYTARQKAVNTARPNSAVVKAVRENQIQVRNMSYLSDFKEFDGGYVTFGEEPKEGKLLVKELLKLMYDKKNNVLFTDTGCFVLSPDFKLADKSQVLLKVPRKNNMYSVDMKNIVPKECLTCLVAKATLDESMLWHRRLGHGKQHKASCKSKIQNSITQPLFMLHMDLFGPTFVSSLMNKKYCLVVTDDYSRFTWVFFLATKDETSGILKSFITEIENLVDKKVKIIRCDNGTEFKNRVMSEFCEQKGIKREFSIARTPQQNGVAERRNRTLIEAARTMVLVVKPHNKTPYELFRGKFDGKSDEGFFIGYSLNSKAFRVYNIRTRKVEENLHIRFLENKSIIAGDGPKWLFDIDVLTKSMNYVTVVAGTNSNDLVDGSLFDSSLKNVSNDEPQPSSDAKKKDDEGDNATHANFFGGETEVDMSNITTAYPVPSTLNIRIHKDHALDHVLGDVQSGEEPRKVIEALKDPSWIEAMQEGLLQFKLQQVWTLVDLPYGKRALSTKWVYRNKKDERCIVIRNKARLVAQGYTQEEGIDSDEVFALVARIKAIRLFLVYALFKDIVVYQMDVKSAFLYGKIEEEVYVCQPPGFEDLEYPVRVYKIEKALYGLRQAHRAWYETLSTYLLDNGFQRGQIDKTLFIKRVKSHILLVQVYVDDIIFGSTKKKLCTEFETLMHKMFQMSSMGKLTFFLGLQVTQKDDGIFINQDKYVDEILKKFGFLTVNTASTPMETSKPLLKDAEAEDVDVYLYRSMIGSLMYLTSLRPDIMFVVCACARFQVTPKVS
ncbi:retrovirus-related pol polyprotein from transposon TNT 1-94, partial [Tanacetum coccineum]